MRADLDELVHVDPRVLVIDDERTFEQDREVEAVARYVRASADPHAELDRGAIRVTCENRSFAELVTAWAAIYERSRKALNAYFGMGYGGFSGLDVRAVRVATVAEALHRTMYGTVEAPTVTKANRDAVLAVIEDSDLYKWASERLQGGPSYRDRLLHLASKPDQEAVDLLMTDPTVWAKSLEEVRNGLAHTAHHALDDISLYKLVKITECLLELVLMSALGLDPDVQRSVARRVAYIKSMH